MFSLASVLEGAGKVRNMAVQKKEDGKATIGARIRALRRDAGMTQEQMAEILQLESKSSVSKYESDKKMSTPEQFVTMARVFGTSADYILSGEIPLRDAKMLHAQTLLQSLQLEKTLDAAITILLTLKGLE